jgi:tetratricopeptide (TPR) repeat protein
VQRIASGGVEVDLPYIAMELLEGGRSVVEHARPLTLNASLKLVIDAARAVQHAHQKGVIHRDLKPDNIVVDNAGRLRVIDFGVARAVELEQHAEDHATRAGSVLGTPAYMSPEQLTLPSEELDTRVDVYALGAVLYELVCGRPPFEAAGLPITALAKAITEAGPPGPRTLDADIPKDVEAIILKALARERDERYPSAAALADDLERFLRCETIEARRPTLAHQLRLFARRNRLFAASLAIAFMSLASAVAISVAFALDAREAERQERSAREQADAYLQNALDTNFANVFGFADGIASLEGSTELRAAILRSTMLRLDGLAEEARRDPRNKAKLVSAYVRLGNVLGALDQANVGDLDGAAQAYGRAASLLDGAEDDPTLLRPWMEVERVLGNQERAAGDFNAALVHHERALELARTELSLHPDDPNLRENVLRRLREVGSTHGSLENHERSLELLEEVLLGIGDLLASNPENRVLRYRYANTLSTVAGATCNAIGPDESLPIFEEALAQLDELLADEPGYRSASASLVGIRHPYTEALVRAGRIDEAIEQAENGIFRADGLLASDPTDLQIRRWRGLLLYNAGWAYQERADAARSGGATPAETDDDLTLARQCLEACHDFFAGLRDEGSLSGFESTFFATIEGRLDEIAAAGGIR